MEMFPKLNVVTYKQEDHMKILIAVMFLTIGFAEAGTIRSMNECNVALYKSNPWKNTYTLENSRVNGKEARAQILAIKNDGGAVTATIDTLGVKRYSTVEKRTVLSKEGSEVDSCVGMTYAIKVETCTVNPLKQVCETSCKFEWRGLDCR